MNHIIWLSDIFARHFRGVPVVYFSTKHAVPYIGEDECHREGKAADANSIETRDSLEMIYMR